MPFNLPQRQPNFSSAQRPQEESYWRSASKNTHTNGNTQGGFVSKINGLISGEQDLPMYKDKPHFPGGQKRGRKDKSLSALSAIGAVAVLLWWIGILRLPGLEPPPSLQPGRSRNHQSWLPGSKTTSVDWSMRREAVKDAFISSWDAYEKYGWGMDEYHPVSRTGKTMVDGGMGWIIVDALDTMIMMNLTSRVKHAREWIETSLSYETNHAVNTFETTIRMVGGLLSAHYLSTTFPALAPLVDDDANQPGEDLYIEKATDLADRLLGAYDSVSGIPWASVNLNTSIGVAPVSTGGASSTAEAATLQLEMKYLAKLTGETLYWEKAEKVIETIDKQHRHDGLLPIYIHPLTGEFRGENIRLGSRGDSYYEYLIKQYLQTSEEEEVYLEMWTEALEGVKKHLITYSKHSSLTVLAERPSGLHQPLSPKMDHLVCFMPGTIALSVTGGTTVNDAKARLGAQWTEKHDENIRLAEELMKTCWGMYKVTATGLAPEIAYFNVDDPPRRWNLDGEQPVSEPLDTSEDADWRLDYDIKMNDVHNLQRPETVESLFYMYRITENPMYREWGWEMFESFMKHTAVVSASDKENILGYTSLDSVQSVPALQRDNMESFWLAETLKYFYLLFGPERDFPLDKIVINTEAHFFPRFEMGRTFKTGWKRHRETEDHEHDKGEFVPGQEKEWFVKNDVD